MNPVVDQNEIKRWFNKSEKLHRTDGPAVVHPNSYQAWYLNGQLHRKDGPAIMYSNGFQEWWLNGLRHRTDGPAIIWPDGSQEWYLNGQLHRTDGPAIIWPDGSQAWYLNGKKLSKELFLRLTQDPTINLSIYLGLGFDEFIAEKFQESEKITSTDDTQTHN